MPEVVGILEMTWPLLLSLVRSCVYARNNVVSSRGFVIDPSDPNSHQIGGARTAVEALGLSSGEVMVSGPEAVEEVFAAIAKDGYDGAMIGGSMFFNERKRVGAAALANKVPTISLIAEAVPYGLLMSYGPDFPEFFRRAAG
jgi:putative ABC transport system substrate-binding protein